MTEIFMILGFALAAYAIVANDSIQTLGTFLASNSKRPWWSLWIWISGIMVVTVTWGWIANGGDPASAALRRRVKTFRTQMILGGSLLGSLLFPRSVWLS